MRFSDQLECESKATTSNVFEALSAGSRQQTIHPVTEKTMETVRLLVVSRESSILHPLWAMGKSNSWQLDSTASGWGAMERVQSGVTPDLLLLDLPQGDGDGLHILRWLRRLRPSLPILLICDPSDKATQQEAIRLGARECLLRPVEDQHFEDVIKSHLSPAGCSNDVAITSQDVELISDGFYFVGTSSLMRNLRAQADLLATADVPVLVLGERGSGKETTARLLHKLSVRSGFEFAKVTCAALPSDLLEAELFGDGNTGTEPHPSKPGKFKVCDKGTILLDEITEMPLSLQAKLVQVLQQRRSARLGVGKPSEFDVRVLATTTANVESAILENKLREDLYFLLSTYTIHVPPLRQRREEIPLLLRHFMHQLAKHYGLTPRGFSPAVLKACRAYSWPGNLREMENFVKRYLLGGKELAFTNHRNGFEELSEDENVEASPVAVARAPSGGPSAAGASGSDSLKSLVRSVKLEAERNAIAAALEKTGWNRKAAARLLKVSYRTLLYKIDQYQLKPSSSGVFATGTSFGNDGN